MGGAELFGVVERADCDLRGESGACIAAAWRAGFRRCGDFGVVLVGHLARVAMEAANKRTGRKFCLRGEDLPFLETLVSASLLLILLRGTTLSGSFGPSRMVRCEIGRV